MTRQEKSWNLSKKQARFIRKVGIRDKRPRILIVCEGKKTEPNYFKGFRITSVNLVIEPVGAVHYDVVSRAIEILDEDNDYQETWCIFDRDKQLDRPNDAELFNQAIQLAKNNNINVAYSNDAFELWYLLHFNYMDNSILRSDYIVRLKSIMGNYKKNDPNMYAKLEDKMDIAIRNARKLYDKCNKRDPANADPSTTVFKLVEKLRSIK